MTLNHGHAYTSHIQRGGVGLLEYLCAEFRHSGREVWAARLAAGEIVLDGQRLWGDQRLRAGQTLIWHRPPWAEEDVPLHFEVIYEDADLLAVAKPAGLPTMPGGGFLERTLLTLVRRQWPAASPLHRLGRGTSGLVLFALNPVTASALLRDWREHRVHKVYRALAAGVAGQESYDIRTLIGPVTHSKLGQIFAASPGGKPAHSQAEVLERRADSTLFGVQIMTGRPHQIRIHLASVGLPLLGDPLYAAGGHARPDGLPGDLGYLLHAHRLELTHPGTGKRLELQAAPPALLEATP
ncbi:RluA family pseudouridine synthase [Deinococcus sp.]|uniref:RluA family pseudouridine synthase n=1 Tax=Deinococcus sp. TaxID=47478 RepID=UPI0025BE513D|nr:RluA family pseudouridine synthase [Deinococcus sp.]